MSAPYLLASIAVVGGVAIGGLAGVRALVQHNAEIYRKSYLISFPRDLEFNAVVSFIRSLSSIGGSNLARLNGIPTVTFEIYADSNGIQHRMTMPSRVADFVIGQLAGHLPGVVWKPVEIEDDWTQACELKLNHGRTPLKIPIPESVVTSILSSLNPLNPGDAVMIQWVMTSGVQFEEDWEKHSYLVVGRLAARAETSEDAQRLAHRLYQGLSGLKGFGINLSKKKIHTGLVAVKNRRMMVVRNPVRVFATELAAMIAFADKSQRVHGLPDGISRQLSASNLIPEDSDFILGLSNVYGNERRIGLSVEDSGKHIWLSGPSGVGKSNTLHNFSVQIMEQGFGMLLIEPKGDLVEDVLNTIPKSRQDDVIVFDPSDINYPIGLNILASSDPERMAGNVVAMFRNIYHESWGPRLEYILRYSVLTAALKGLSLYDVKQLLVSPSFRRGVLRSIKNPDVREFWQVFERGPDNAADSVINKLDAFLGHTLIRNIVGQPVSAFDMGQAMSEGKIILAPMSNGLLGDDTASMMGSMLVSLAWTAGRARAGLTREARKPFFIVIDEVQQFANMPVSLNEAAAQARGYGLHLIFSNQSPTQLKPDVRHALQVNFGNKIVFRQAADDAKSFASEFAPYMQATDLQTLGRYETAMKLMAGNQAVPPATATMAPAPRATGSAWAVRSASRERYGTPATEVEEAFSKRHQALNDDVKRPVFGVVEEDQ